jgi:hypothetical protein
MTEQQHDQPPEGFTVVGEESRQEEAARGGIVARELEPDGVGGQVPGYDGSAPDDSAITDPDADGVDDDI